AIRIATEDELFCETATPLTRTAGINDKFALIEDNRRLHFRPLHRNISHVVRKAHRCQPVATRSRAHTAKRVLVQGESTAVAAPAVDVKLPSGYSTRIRRNAIWNELREDAEHKLAHQLANTQPPERRCRI